MPEQVEIHAERESDIEAIRRVHTAAFGDDGRVAGLVDALRAASAPLPPLSFAASVDGQVAGQVMLSASRLDAPPRLIDVYVLSPLGVLPGLQRRGIGTRLHGIAGLYVDGLCCTVGTLCAVVLIVLTRIGAAVCRRCLLVLRILQMRIESGVVALLVVTPSRRLRDITACRCLAGRWNGG